MKTTDAHSVLRGRHVAMISIGGVIGASLFVGSSSAIATAGPGVFLSYLLAGLIILCVTRMLGEMTVDDPQAGSFVAHVRRGLGARAAFVGGWIYWVMWATILGIEAIAAASFLAPFVPLPFLVTECLVIAAMTAINLFSVRGYGEFEFWFSMTKIMTIVIFIAIGLWALLGTHAQVVARNLAGQGGLFPHGGSALLACIPAIMLSMAGAEITTIAATETSHPAESVGRATRSVVLRILFFYLGSIGLILCLTPWEAVVPGRSPFLTTLQRIDMPFASLLMTGVMLVATLSALNSGLYVTSRILCELAEAGDAPRFFLARGRNNTPRRAILAGCVIAVAVAVAGMMSPGVVFAFLVSATGTFVLFDYVLIALAQIRLRRRARAAGLVPALPMWCFPWLSYVTLATLVGALLTMLVASGHTRREIVLGALTLGLIVLAERATLALRRGAEHEKRAQDHRQHESRRGLKA
ncbi:amino acid permease [Nguyenibacter sp. L1]|uniref:amino acid permease n=1 Tax=Nguyenibacter sp. L1 TaxID=3049350 RepID=UPI002B48676F|nr:amino acid permease [Nguyenibacter sp. L1]WRH89644.1 amino acid permease [Nguyenibacter sp. L1]